MNDYTKHEQPYYPDYHYGYDPYCHHMPAYYPEHAPAEADQQPNVIVRPIVLKETVTVPAECPKHKAEAAAKKDNATKAKLIAAVAMTVVACSTLRKLFK